MKKQDILSVLITFVVGAFAGGYLYIADFAGKVAEMTVPDAEEVYEFTIVGEVYGGCQLYENCPSFQIVADGSYRYLYTPAAGAEQVMRQGGIPVSLKRKLRTVLTEKALKEQSKPIQPALCNSYTDGIDIKYEITIDKNEYIIDSCGTTVDGEGQVWTTLGSIWDYYETIGNN